MAKPGDWMENTQNLANIGHALGGAVVPLVVALFAKFCARVWLPFLVVEVLLAVYVLGKEYGYDLRFESGETVRSSTEDALGYLIGNGSALGLIGLAMYLGSF